MIIHVEVDLLFVLVNLFFTFRSSSAVSYTFAYISMIYHVYVLFGLLSQSILLNIMFFSPMRRFQSELIYLYFPPSSHLIYVCFCPVGLSLLQQHYQHVLWVLKLVLSTGLGS